MSPFWLNIGAPTTANYVGFTSRSGPLEVFVAGEPCRSSGNL